MADQSSIANALQMKPTFELAPSNAPANVAQTPMQPMAQALQAQGRNNDTMLVHMTPGEVSGLNALAMQTAGQPLTINPATGLPEAGILETILPIAAGFALGPAGFAMMSAPMAALTVGGVTALATGDLGKGLMAGLGAYGGAGLGETLAGAGAAESAAAQQAAAAQTLQAGATGAEAVQAANILNPALASTPGATQATLTGLNEAVMAGAQAGLPAEAVKQSYLQSLAGAGADAYVAQGLAAPTSQLAMQGAQGLGSASGWSNLGTSAAQKWAGMGGLEKGASVMGLAAPLAESMQPAPMAFPTGDEGYQMNYEGPYLPSERRVTYPGAGRTSSSEYSYFTPSNPVPFAEGGETDRSIRMPGAGYQAGTDPEFDYGFRPIQVQAPAQTQQSSYLKISNDPMIGGLPFFEALDKGSPDTFGTGVGLGNILNQGLNKFFRDEGISVRQNENSYAEGGETEDRAIKFAGADYQGGVDPEFGHGFKPVQVEGVDFGGNVASAGNVVPEFFSGKGGRQIANPVLGYTSSGEKIYQYANQDDFMAAGGGKGGRMRGGDDGGSIMGRVLSGIARKKSDSDSDLSSYTNLGDLQYNPMTQRMERMADGGEVRMEDGGFVMDARSVSEIGNGSSNAGLEKLSKLGARPLQGRGDGVSDSIPANIGGSQKARVARDEAYFSPAAVEKLGGSQKLYAMMDKAHKARKNAKRGQDTGGLKALMA